MFKIIKNMAIAGLALVGLLCIVTLSSSRLRAAAYNQYQATGFGDITVENILINALGIYDSGGTLRYTPGTTNAFVGSLTTTGTIGLLSNAAPRTNITPVAVGALIWDSAGSVVCMATGTTKTSWTLITASNTACPH